MDSVVLAIAGLGTTSLVAMYIAVMARSEARAARELAERLGRRLTDLSKLVDETDESLSSSIADILETLIGGRS